MVCRTHHTFPRLCLDWGLLLTSPRTHTGPCQHPHSKQLLSCTSVAKVVLQVHTPGWSHISSATSQICGREHHWLSSPSWDLLYMAWTSLELVCCALMRWNDTSGSGSGLLETSDSSCNKLLFLWADLLVFLGMMGLWIWKLRTLPFNTNLLFLEQVVNKLEKLQHCWWEHCRQWFSHGQNLWAALNFLSLWIGFLRLLSINLKNSTYITSSVQVW